MSGEKKPAEATQSAQSQILDRNGIRAAIFANKPKSEIVDFLGTKVEVRQPPLGVILDRSGDSDGDAEIGDNRGNTVKMFCQYIFVPGTNEKVFEPSDFEGLMELPFGPDFNKLQGVVNRLAGFDTSALMQQVEDDTKSAEV